MDQIYPDEGLSMLLQRMAVGDFKFHLFTNNVTPDRSTTLSGLTEAAWSGYSPITVAAADFILVSIVAHIGNIQAAPIAFTNTSGGSQTAYGYYITDVSVTKLLGVARFDSAPVTKGIGESWLVVPVLGDYSGLAS